MKRALACAGLALLAFSAQADDMLFRQGNLSIRLTQSPCVLPEAATAMAAVIPSAAHAAEVMEGSAKTVACWAIDSDGDVLIVTQDGRGGYVPGSAFKRAPNI